jgi:NADPH2:quinone reductase
VDLVLDPVGGDMTDLAFRTLGWGGRHLMVGFAGGQIGTLRSNLAIVKGASLVGVDIRQFGEREPEKFRALIADVAALHREGRIRPRVAAIFALEHFSQAATRAMARDTVGRILICP